MRMATLVCKAVAVRLALSRGCAGTRGDPAENAAGPCFQGEASVGEAVLLNTAATDGGDPAHGAVFAAKCDFFHDKRTVLLGRE